MENRVVDLFQEYHNAIIAVLFDQEYAVMTDSVVHLVPFAWAIIYVGIIQT